jgi:soluble lytic murein transglycosylase
MRMSLRALWITLLAMLLVSPGPGFAGILTDSDREAYRAAFEAVHAADWGTAYRNAALATDPVLQKAVRYFALTRGDPSARFDEIVQFLTQNPNWPGEMQLRQRADDVAASASDAVVQAWYDRFPPITPFGKLRQAELWLARGDTARATEQIRQVWINSDLNAFDEKSMLQKYGIYLRPADHVARLDRLLWDGREEQARRMLPMVDTAHRLEAEARMALAARAPKAEKLLHDVPSELQNDPGLLFERMQWRRHQDDYDGAIAILDHAPSDLVRPDAWYRERELLARRALQTGSITIAYRLASHHGLTTGPNFADGEFLAGWISLRFLHDPQTAYTHFVRIYGDATRPITLTRAAYWAGRAAEELKYRELSTTWYSTAAQYLTTYYGQLAASQIGADGKAAVVEDPHPTAPQTAAFEQNELVRVTRAMGEASAADLTKPFMLRLVELAKSPAEYTLIAQLAQVIGRTDVAVTVARRASFAGVTLLDVGYPLADMPPGNNLEAPLVLAVTRQESGFDPTALSPAGARGMMQLMPGTAKTVAKNLQIAYSQQRLLTDASYNMTLGCAYLSDMLERFGGSYVLAVAAYNAGPARVNQWLQAQGDPRAPDVDAVDWVESISIGETRNYVQRVLENVQIYRLRLGDRNLAFSLPTDLKR